MSVQVATIPSGVRLSAAMTCPRCEGGMVVVSTSAATSREWKAVMRCDGCNAEQLLLVRLLEVAEIYDGGRGPNPVRCGTAPGYHAHRARNEPACEPCKNAHRSYETERRANRRRREH